MVTENDFFSLVFQTFMFRNVTKHELYSDLSSDIKRLLDDLLSNYILDCARAV